MACTIISELYNGLPSLYANAGKWVSAKTQFKINYASGSGFSNKFTMSGNSIVRDSGNWGDFGFTVGDVITISATKLNNPSAGALSYSRTITYINANTMFIDSALPSPHASAVFPTEGVYNGATVSANKAPDAVEFYFNLAKNGVLTESSVIDGEMNRFEAQNVDALALLGSMSMTQLGNKSGGLVKDVTIKYASISGSTRTYEIEYKFLQYGLLQDGNLIPNYYDANNCLAPYIKIRTFSIYGNPNGVQTGVNGVHQANTGYFNENYNGQPNIYSFDNIQWFDLLGNSIEKMDYSGHSRFKAYINATGQSTTLSKYRIGMFFNTIEPDFYKNLPLNIGQNLMLNAPDVDFTHSIVASPTVYTSGTNSSGANYGLTELKFTISGGQIIVSGRIQPNQDFNDFMELLPDGSRGIRMFVQVSDYSLIDQFNNEVNLLVYDEDCYDAPNVGVQHPYVISETLYDHDLIDITDNSTPNTTTEDDVLYKAEIQLLESVEYDGIRVGISARNSVTEEEFTLESLFVPFTSVPIVNGIYQLDETINRTFVLPPDTDRNAVKVYLNPVNDVLGSRFGVTIEYGFLNRWEYWLNQSNANLDFFILNDPNNGLNKDWQHYQNGDWSLSVDFFVRRQDVDDFNHYLLKDRPYEDDPNVTCDVTFTASDGSNPLALLANDLMEIEAVFTWNQTFTDEWSTIAVENFEGVRIGFISSVLDQGGIGSNPLKPLNGETGLQLTNGGTTLTAKCLIDTNDIDVENVSLSFRVHASPAIEVGYLITFRKDALIAYSLRKVSNNDTYLDTDPCLKIRRSSDNALQDIGFANGVLDTAALLTFIGANSGYVHTIYDQAGNSNHAVQTDNTKQPLLVNAGVVNVDPDNGLPSLLFDGVDDFFNLTTTFSTSNDLLQTAVFNRNASGNITLGNSTDNASSGVWLGIGSDEIVTFLGSSSVDHSANTTAGTVLLSTSHNAANDTKVSVNGVLFNTVNEAVNFNNFEYFGKLSAFINTGHFQELVYWAKDKSLEQAQLEQNIIDYYGL